METKKQLIEQVKQLESQLQELRERNKVFNKYKFVEDLETEIKDGINKGEINDEDDIREYIDTELDRQCIYYKDCFEIAMELNATDFTAFEIDEVNNISQLAYAALSEYVWENIEMQMLEDLIEAKQNA